jgi:hypothetical protein
MALHSPVAWYYWRNKPLASGLEQFCGPLKNHMILRMIFRSGHIDIFGQLGSQLFSLVRDALRMIFTDDNKTMIMIFH